MPKVDLKATLARLPSPHKMKEELNKSFSQQLACRARVEDVETQKAREMLTKKKTPAELAQLNHPFDIPLPKIKLPKVSKSRPSSADDLHREKSHEEFYGTLPKSWREKNIVTGNKVILDADEGQKRQELVKTKTPAELAQFHSIQDFPLPTKVKSLLSPSERKIMAQKLQQRRASINSDKRTWGDKFGDLFKANENVVSLKTANSEAILTSSSTSWKDQKLLTNVKVHADNEEMVKRRALTSAKSPAELAQINSLNEIPIPTTLKRMMTSKPKLGRSKSLSHVDPKETPASNKEEPFKTMLKTQCLTRSRVEDPEIQATRADVVKNKTVAELSQITNLSDIPVPNFGLFKSKPKEVNEPKSAPNYIPESLKSQLLCATKTDQDSELMRQRMEIVRSQSPAQLSQFHSVKDIPLPTFKGSRPSSPERSKSPQSPPPQTPVNGDNWYNSLPRSLTSELKCRSKIEDPEVQQLRAEAVKAKSVNELSQIKTLDDIPLPQTLENLVGRTGNRPVERRKRFREKKLSMSTKSLQDKFDTLKSEKILCESKVQDPDAVKERRQIAASRSVSELSQISGLSDFPLPTPVEKLIKSAQATSSKASSHSKDRVDYSHLSPMAIHDTIYSTLPRNMKTELLVKSKVVSNADEATLARQKLVASKSVGELSKVTSLSDLPIPSPIQHLWEAGKKRYNEVPFDDSSSYGTGRSGSRLGGHYDIYSTLPSSMKRECLVRSKVETDYDTLNKRRALVQSKSPAELSQITTLSDLPVPRRIEDWINNAK